MTKNIYDISHIPVDMGEIFQDLCTHNNVRIECIVSYGDTTPQGEWYDQDWGEWVMVLQGSADMTVIIDGVQTDVALHTGDSTFFPPHQKHRVNRTDSPTIWLAVHVYKAG